MTNLDTKKIGGKIADARKKLNFSQAQLAESLFISAQAVGKWERGESMPDILMLNRLAEILEVDLNYFSGRIPSESLEKTPQEQLNSQAKKLHWDLSSSSWVDADFSELNNLADKFSSSNIQRCKFINSDLSGLLLKNNHVIDCDFSGSNISSSQIQGSNLKSNQFTTCLLQESEFLNCNIKFCDFSNANFSGMTIKSCNFQKNAILNAVCNRTSFSGTQITDTVFEGSIEDCSFENCGFTRVTFQNATLTNSFFKNNKNLKRVQFIDCKADRMTYEFLKNGKADLNGITLLTT